jgi:hypothetical protein
VTYTTPGSFWARYRQEQEARLARLAAEGLKAPAKCAVRGCGNPVRQRMTKAGQASRYCTVHADAEHWRDRTGAVLRRPVRHVRRAGEVS